MTRSLGGNPNYMHIILNGLARSLFWGLEHRSHIHIKAQVSKGRSNHLGAAIMSILPHLHHQHARTTTMGFSKLSYFFHNIHKALIPFVGRTIDTANRSGLRAVTTPFFFQRITDLAHSSSHSCGIHSQLKQVALTAFRRFSQCSQCPLTGFTVTLGTNFFQTGNLRVTHGTVINI